MKGDEIDPKALIAEAYNIEGITPEECRSIFLDWALSVPVDAKMQDLIEALLARHGTTDHPMTVVLQDGMAARAAPRRRGGWRSRPRS